MRLLISGYGGKSGDTAGIYDLNEGRFIWRSGIESISFICEGEDGAFFGAGEHDDHGFVYMFTPDGNGGFRLADAARIDGGALCHIAYSRRHKILTGACYASGDVFSLAVKRDGFGKMKSYARQGGGVAKLSRAHCVVFNRDEDELLSANIALDRLYRYEIKDGALLESGYAQMDGGIGPRHLYMLDGRRYVITEYSNEIIALDDADETGAASIQRISTLPDGFDGESYCSTLCFLPLHAGFGYMYAANRGADTIAVFKRDKLTGRLEKIHDCDCGGKCPRHIEIVGQAPMLAVANQDSGEVTLFKINGDGSLGERAAVIPFEGASFAGVYHYG
jgi:6-phosphogluconolactonase